MFTSRAPMNGRKRRSILRPASSNIIV
jgi:hypothetical protein